MSDVSGEAPRVELVQRDSQIARLIVSVCGAVQPVGLQRGVTYRLGDETVRREEDIGGHRRTRKNQNGNN